MTADPIAITPTDAAPTPRAAEACIILNAASGQKDPEGREALEAAARGGDGRFDLEVVEKGQDIAETAERAADRGAATLVAAGGDGTINAIAEVAHARGLTLGVVPMGTFNFFARGLGIPEDPEAALDVLAKGHTRAIDLARINGRAFLNNASLGLYPAILAEREGIYRRWGRSRLAAHWSVLSTFLRFHRPVAMKVTVNGETIRTRTPLLFAARSAHQLELFELRGAEDVRDGRLALFLLPDGSRWRLLLLAARLLRHGLREGHDYEYLSAERVRVETVAPLRMVARDGERDWMRSPFDLHVERGALRVIVPEDTP